MAYHLIYRPLNKHYARKPAKHRSTRHGLIGGNRAAKVNPLGLRRQFKAICVTHNDILSPAWRSSKDEANKDNTTHRGVGYYIDYLVDISQPM